MPWVSEHYVKYSREVQSSDAGKPSLVVSFGPNRYENSAGHEEQYDWSCTCEDWRFRRSKDGGYCKHIEHVQGLSPQQGGRSLWKSSKIDQPLSIPSKDTLEALRVELTHDHDDPEGDLEKLEELGHALVESVQVYIPVTDQNGQLIPAIFLPDTKPVFSKKLADVNVVIPVVRGALRISGSLNGTQFGAYLAYQDLQTQQLYDACVDMGFNPNYLFTIEASPDDTSTPCKNCGSHMTRVMSIDPTNDGYVCTNPDCSNDINKIANQQMFYKTSENTVPVAPVSPSKPKSPPKPNKRSQ